MRFVRTLSIITTSVILASTTVIITPLTALAANIDDTVTASEISTALNRTDNKNGNLVAEPISSKTDIDSAAVVMKGGSTIDIPKNPEDGVSLQNKGAPEVTIGLPNADDSANAKKLSDGTIVYPGSNGSANAVIPTEQGVQMLTTISNINAPTRYSYPIDVPNGGKVMLNEDGSGSAFVVDGNGAPVLVIATPWAKDANNDTVPTWFETDGITLTQVIEHTSGNYAYPVVADPSFWGFVGCIFGTGIPIGAAIAMVLAPYTWGTLIKVSTALNLRPTTAASYVDHVYRLCRSAIW